MHQDREQYYSVDFRSGKLVVLLADNPRTAATKAQESGWRWDVPTKVSKRIGADWVEILGVL